MTGYDFALSYGDDSGPVRQVVKEVAALLRDRGRRVFFDRAEAQALWGEDLNVKLGEIYRGARITVAFVTKTYAGSVWTPLERALNDSQSEEIYLLVSGLPIRSPGSKDPNDLVEKVREINRSRDVVIHVIYVLPRVAPDDVRGDAARTDLLSAMDRVYKPLAKANRGSVYMRTRLAGLDKPKPAKGAK